MVTVSIISADQYARFIEAGDIATKWNVAKSFGDYQQFGPALLAGSNLETAVLLSLFSDREANEDDAIPDGGDDRRGWWGDIGEDIPLGSRLWLLERGKLALQTARDAEDFAKEALAWTLADGVASRVDAVATIFLPSMLILNVTLFQRDGILLSFNFAWVWKEIT